ncbi:MAG: preprotein translocase subunit SecG [Holophagaceae bacterium]|jgi:preprotein translocase subunit SecG|nr:preprotein translocase subunit SecG [Acidobacteriota bacterium]
MSGLVLTFHILVSVLLVAAILLQPGSKGRGGLGSAYGGGSSGAFGPQGATPFLAKATYWLAGGFLATSFIIELLIVKSNKSVLDAKPAISIPAPTDAPKNTPSP